MQKFLAAALLGSALAMSVSAAFADENRPFPQQNLVAPADMQTPGYATPGGTETAPVFPTNFDHINNQ